MKAAQVQAKAKIAELEALGELCQKYPDLLRMKQLELVMAGMTKMNLTVTTPELGAMMSGFMGRPPATVPTSFVSSMFSPAVSQSKKELKEVEPVKVRDPSL